MAKADSIQRLILVAHRINARPYITIEELSEWLSVELSKNSYAQACSPNTIKRDILSLRRDFSIDVKFSRAKNGYYIDKSDDGYNPSLSLIEMFDTLSALGAKGSTPSFIHLEPFKPKGTKHLHTIIDAIDKSQSIEFRYSKYSINNSSHRTISPYAIKQMRGRWYVIGREQGGNIKTFGLDRIEELHISNSPFEADNNFSMEDKFAYSYGIYSGENYPVEDITLSFDAEDGGYLKSVPLHSSQEVLVDTEDEFRIKLRLRITLDFVKEIVSRSWSVKVIAPDSLKEKICTIYREALERNSN